MIKENVLIQQLSGKERLHLLQHCDYVQLVLADVLCERGELIRYVYFPLSGFISLSIRTDNDHGFEIGVIGNEGMLGVELALGVSIAPLRALVKSSGYALRIKSRIFQKVFSSSIVLKRNLYRYLYGVMDNLVTTSVCLRFHLTGSRIARWLLESQDRNHNNSISITHNLLASILGVRRVSVTLAVNIFQDDGLIECGRGQITINDREGLKRIACSCYKPVKSL